MADKVYRQDQGVERDMKSRYKDMGDGTHALVTAVGGTIAVSGGLTDGQLRATPVDVEITAGSAAIGTVGITTVTLPTTLLNGVVQVVTATTRVALAASTPLISGVTVKAAVTNTGIIYVGNSTVAAANGYRLNAGDSVFIEIANLATVYVDASVNAQYVTYIAS